MGGRRCQTAAIAQAPRRITNDPLEEINRRIRDHPGSVEHQRIDGLGQTLMIFRRNWAELSMVLEAPTKDYGLAMGLVQNAHRPDVRDQFRLEMVQRLHKYVASAGTLVDHSRRIMRDRVGSIGAEFERRKEAFLANPEVHFITGLRNFTLHRELAFIGHRLSFTNMNTDDPQWSSEVQLNVENLLTWDGWSPQAREFAEAQGTVMVLRPVIDDHGRLILELNVWLVNALGDADREALEQVNELVVERNAILMRTDLGEAKRMTEEWTRRRNMPAEALRMEPPFPFPAQPASYQAQPAEHASPAPGTDSDAEPAGDDVAQPDGRH